MTNRQRNYLSRMDPQEWRRPVEIEGKTSNQTSAYLSILMEKGLVERRAFVIGNGLSTNYRYRLTDAGVAEASSGYAIDYTI